MKSLLNQSTEVYVNFIRFGQKQSFVFKSDKYALPNQTQEYLENGWAIYNNDGLKSQHQFNSFSSVYALACPLE